jgi:hypothetical protein
MTGEFSENTKNTNTAEQDELRQFLMTAMHHDLNDPSVT